MAFELVVLSGPCRCGDSIDLALRKAQVIGRELEADFRFRNDLQMSSAHFSIAAVDDACEIVDLESTNGTFLNGRRITREFARAGDEIRAGNTTFEVQGKVVASPPVVASSPVVNQIDESSPTGALSIETSDGERRWVASDSRLTVGRSELSDWIFASDPRLSSQHFAIQSNHGLWEVFDLSSTNGTFLNGQRIEQSGLSSGDEIRAGSTTFTVTFSDVALSEDRRAPPIESSVAIELRSPDVARQPPDSTGGALAVSESYFLRCLTRDDWSMTIRPGESYTLGRSFEADLSMPDATQVSSRHACLSLISDQCLLTDLNSTNGTFVNGQQIQQASLASGDRISIANVVFELDKISAEHRPNSRGGTVDDFDRYDQRDVDYYPPVFPTVKVAPTLPFESEQAAEVEVPPPLAAKAPSQVPSDLPPLSVYAEDALPFDEIPYESFPCGSGLVLYRGGSARFDPIDIARRLLLASPGWMVVKGTAEAKAIDSKSESSPASFAFEVSPLPTEDVSWMLPWNEQWGQHQSLIVYSRSDAKRIESSFEQLQQHLGMTEQQPWFTPDSLTDFLANRLHDTVNRFFSPFDAILVEISGGKRWAYFAPKDLEKVMSGLRFRRRKSW